MIFCVIRCCCCMYRREVFGLTLISKISMNCHFLTLCIHMLISNNRLTCQRHTRKRKGYVNRSIRFFCRKLSRCGNFVSCIIYNFLTSCLINKCSCHGVSASDLNTVVTHSINQCDILICCRAVASVLRINQCRSDTRNIDNLIGIRNIGMCCNSHTIQIQILKEYILTSAESIGCVKIEYYVNASIAFGWCKFSACGNASSIGYNRISCGRHQHTSHGISLTRL